MTRSVYLNDSGRGFRMSHGYMCFCSYNYMYSLVPTYFKLYNKICLGQDDESLFLRKEGGENVVHGQGIYFPCFEFWGLTIEEPQRFCFFLRGQPLWDTTAFIQARWRKTTYPPSLVITNKIRVLANRTRVFPIHQFFVWYAAETQLISCRVIVHDKFLKELFADPAFVVAISVCSAVAIPAIP